MDPGSLGFRVEAGQSGQRGKPEKDIGFKTPILGNWGPPDNLFFFVCSAACALREWIYYLFSLKISFWWEILGTHQGWISARPSTLRWCKLNRPGWGPSSRLSSTLLLVKEKTIRCVQMCFLNGTCDTFIYPLWCLEPVLFTSFPAVQGKSVGNLQFFSNWFSCPGLFVLFFK